MKLIDANTGDNIFTQPSSTTPIAWATIKVSCSDLQGSVSSSNSQYNINAYMLKMDYGIIWARAMLYQG